MKTVGFWTTFKTEAQMRKKTSNVVFFHRLDLSTTRASLERCDQNPPCPTLAKKATIFYFYCNAFWKQSYRTATAANLSLVEKHITISSQLIYSALKKEKLSASVSWSDSKFWWNLLQPFKAFVCFRWLSSVTNLSNFLILWPSTPSMNWTNECLNQCLVSFLLVLPSNRVPFCCFLPRLRVNMNNFVFFKF